jgi:hypothetical protein
MAPSGVYGGFGGQPHYGAAEGAIVYGGPGLHGSAGLFDPARVPAPFGPRIGADARLGRGLGWDDDFLRATLFLPQHLDPGINLLFTSVNLGGTIDGGGIVNLGGGYRQYAPSIDRVFGASGWFDFDSGHQRSWYRAGVSLESLGRYLDFRLNTYHVVGRKTRPLFDGFVDPFFEGPFLNVRHLRTVETSFSGVDAQTGGLLPFVRPNGL